MSNRKGDTRGNNANNANNAGRSPSYQQVVNEYQRCQKQMDMENWDYAPIAMRKTVEAMAQYILAEYEPPADEAPVTLFEKIDFWDKHRLIRSSSVDNYHKIRMFGNRGSHSGSGRITGATCRIYQNMLREEFDQFCRDYAKRNYRPPKPAANPQPVPTAAADTKDVRPSSIVPWLIFTAVWVAAVVYFLLLR